jgi:predicted amidohydrolase YtcJ
MKQLLKMAISAGLACTALQSVAAVDVILHNAKVYTAEPGQPLQQAVAVDGEKIVAVGSDLAVLRLKGEARR